MSERPTSLYEPDGDLFAATAYTRGPWNPEHQHAGPPAALLSRAIDRASGLHDGQTARISFDILRPVPVARLRVEARILRPGRRVEQVEATLCDEAGAALMRATAWRMRRENVEVPERLAVTEPPPEGPEGGRPGGWIRPEVADPRLDVAWFHSLEWRFVQGGFDAPGPGLAWTRLRVPVVAGEPPSGLERLLVMADGASGISYELDWSRYLFINTDLGVHLEREPRGEWFAMDARTRIGDAGMGLCTAVLSDQQGRVGVSTQSLLIDSRA